MLLEGTIGDVILYKSRHGYLVRSKGGISAQRIASEECLARSRESNNEFGYAMIVV